MRRCPDTRLERYHAGRQSLFRAAHALLVLLVMIRAYVIYSCFTDILRTDYISHAPAPTIL